MTVISGECCLADKIKYITGGTLPPDAAVYQERPADSELLSLCLDGQFAYVLTSRQMGKSSLMARTARKLQEQGIVTAIIDLTSIGTRETSAEQWYLGVLAQIESFCSPETGVFAWWQDNAALSPAQRFSNYITGVLLKEISQKIVIFVDEIDSTLGLGFTDDFFAAIRAFHNRRSIHPDLYCISLVLLGVATPDELIRDRARTPFNIGQAVELGDFVLEQVLSLIKPLKLGASEQATVQQILKWTGGQPYLTQKLCALLADNVNQADNLENLIMANWLSDKFKNDPHFQFITSYLAATPQHYKKEVFETYEVCYLGKKAPCRDASFAHNRLRLSGLLKRQDGDLIIRNEIYRKLFDRKWIRENRPTFWTERNKKIALYVFSAACLAVAAFMIYLWLLSKELAKEATSLRLQVEAQAILSDTMTGADLLAMQKSAAAFRIVESNKSYCGLLAIDANKTYGSLLETLTVPNKNLWIGNSAASIYAVAFSPDGKRIISGSSDYTVRIWPRPDFWIDELCKKLTRNMSRKEWRDSVSKDIGYIEQCPGLPIPPDEPEAAAAAKQ
jgi:AAA-like domain/WD domain, G-beta repeat